MKISSLERIIFVTVFVLTAGICLGFLFGYRYSFDQQRLEQRGVLVLGGSMEQMYVDLPTGPRTVSLPYVNTSIPLGTHRILAQKRGYVTMEADVTVGTDEAAVLALDLAPQLLTGQQRVFETSNEEKPYYFPSFGVTSFQTASGSLLLHAEKSTSLPIYLPSVLRQQDTTNAQLQQISSTEILVTTENAAALYNTQDRQWMQLRRQPDEEFVVDQGMVLLYDKAAGTLRYVSVENGQPEKEPFLENITAIHPGSVTSVGQDVMYMLYENAQGVTFKLVPRWFDTPLVEQLPTYDSFRFGNISFVLTKQGSLEYAGTTILQDVQKIFHDTNAYFVVTGDHAMYLLKKDGTLSFLNRFSSPILAFASQEKSLFTYVQTEKALYYCERSTMQRCQQLAVSTTPRAERGVNIRDGYLWFIDDQETLHLVPFFREAL